MKLECFPPTAQTYGSHLGLGLVSMMDVEDTQRESLGLLQLLHGQYMGPNIVMLQKDTSSQKSMSL
jgi:hypothetical protein